MTIFHKSSFKTNIIPYLPKTEPSSRRKLVFSQPYNRGLVTVEDMATRWHTENTVYRVCGEGKVWGLSSKSTVRVVMGSQLRAYTIAIQDRIIMVRRLRRNSLLARTQWVIIDIMGKTVQYTNFQFQILSLNEDMFR